MADFFHFVPGYKHYIYASGREPIFFLLLAFLLAFTAVRTYTRVGRSRGWGSGSLRGVHLHHLVPGIVATLASATAIIAFRPGGGPMLLLSACFGAGAAFILDEFALLLHLEDVYWTEHGRSSIEATIMGFAFGVLCLLAATPIHSDPSRDAPHWVVGGLIAVWLGATLGWRWITNPWFRYAHLGAIVFVAGEALIGMACPLTVWEDLARGGVRAESFIGRWVRRLLFYQAPEWVFTAAYVAFALLVLATFVLAPPRWRAEAADARPPATSD